jgi:hypothetical protein
MSLDLRAKVCLWPVSASVHNIKPFGTPAQFSFCQVGGQRPPQGTYRST